MQGSTTTTAVYYETNDSIPVAMNYTLTDFDTSSDEFNGSVTISMEDVQDEEYEHLEFTTLGYVQVEQLQVASSETSFTSIYQLTNGTTYKQYQEVSSCLPNSSIH